MARRFHHIQQRDSRQCGPACLAMIATAMGRETDAEDLEALCQTTSEGISLKTIADIARIEGIESAAATVTPERLRELPLPCILHWDNNHFVVLYEITAKGRYRVADPAAGKVSYTREELTRHWARPEDGGRGVAMFFEPGELFEPRKKTRAASGRKALKFLIGYVNRYRRYFIHILLGLGLGCILQLIFPFLTQAIVDLGIGHRDLGLIWLILIGELFIVGGRTLTDFLRRWILLHISERINISLLSDFFIKLLSLPMHYFDSKQLGDLMQRMNDHSRIEAFLTDQVLSTLFSIISFGVFSVVLFIYSPLIFALFIIGATLQTLWSTAFLRRRRLLDYETFKVAARNNSLTYDFLTFMQEIKLQDCEQRRRWEWEDLQADRIAVKMKSLKLTQTQEAGSIFINETRNIFITVMAAAAVISGELTLGGMMAVQYMVGQLGSPLAQLLGFMFSLQDVRLSLARIGDIHRQEPEDSSVDPEAPVPDGDIALSDLMFRYDRHSDVPILDNLNITIPRGKVTAIVGSSGSGKSTLIKLLLGYYNPEAGAIRVGDTDLRGVSRREWRRRCGVVMQDGVIFGESIARNIATADADIDRERLEEAARMACIDSFIKDLPLGYNTIIGRDGVGISQGQRQRILIARAIYRRPSVLVLDEATNSLDALNESHIVDNLQNYYRGRTVVVVAHRLSTVRNADLIIVMDGGHIIESGNHQSLLERKGTYYNLVKSQLQLDS